MNNFKTRMVNAFTLTKLSAGDYNAVETLGLTSAVLFL